MRPIPLFILSALMLAACGNTAEQQYPELVGYNVYSTDPKVIEQSKSDNLLADDGAIASFFKSVGATKPQDKMTLFQATVDTLSFMPLLTADSKEGIVLTDWYALPEDPNVRYKLDARITSVDTLSLSAFKQTKSKGEWVNAPVPEGFKESIIERISEKAEAAAKSGKKKKK